MGIGERCVLSHPSQQTQPSASIERWLVAPDTAEAPSRLFSFKYGQGPWVSNSSAYKPDADQASIVSIDDNISVSDSANGSYSSESSSQTSWTSTTESSDVFLDDDSKDYLPPLTKHYSHPSGALHDQVHRESQGKEPPTSGSNCTFGYAYEKVNSRRSQPNPSDRLLQTLREGESWVREAQHAFTRRSCSRRCPPKLKRDTEVTEQFVCLLIIFAKRLITAIWPLSDRPPMMSDCFNGAGVLPLCEFIKETLRRSKTSYSTLQVALYYLILLKAKMPHGSSAGKNKGEPHCRAMQCGRRMFLSALMLASKYLQDRNYSARAWSKISGLRSNEINENEREYLSEIDYRLHVPKDIFDNWSKIVLALSKVSMEKPSCVGDVSGTTFGRPGSGSNSLAAMVSQVGLDEKNNQPHFSETWWTCLLQKLEPALLKDTANVDIFLQDNLPRDKLNAMSLPSMAGQLETLRNGSSLSAFAQGCDLNFSDTFKTRGSEPSQSQTPQTPVQMSPASGFPLPRRPFLGNLPTPQTTPRIPDQYSWERGFSRPSLRCASSMDALRSLRKQCLMNANLERCPPPRPQGFALGLPSMKSAMRSTDTIQELPSRSTTPTTSSSPASVSSDSTTFTTRSRSSSISSNSSWSSSVANTSYQRTKVGKIFSSPLAPVSAPSERHSKTASVAFDSSEAQIHDYAYLKSQLPQTNEVPTSSEVAAIHGLMSLSTLSETPSQSVTPTPQRLSVECDAILPTNGFPRGHKRTLSKTEPTLEAQVRQLLSESRRSIDVVQDPLLPYLGSLHREMQIPASLRKENRRPLSTLNNKRLCSMHHTSSTPDLPLHFLNDAITAS